MIPGVPDWLVWIAEIGLGLGLAATIGLFILQWQWAHLYRRITDLELRQDRHRGEIDRGVGGGVD